MANKFELAASAKSDLKEIWTYLAELNPSAADRVFNELKKKFELLAENPKLGRTHDELLLNLRSFPYKDYTIFYFPNEDGVEIFRVRHGARNINELFDTFFEGLQP